MRFYIFSGQRVRSLRKIQRADQFIEFVVNTIHVTMGSGSMPKINRMQCHMLMQMRGIRKGIGYLNDYLIEQYHQIDFKQNLKHQNNAYKFEKVTVSHNREKYQAGKKFQQKETT